jgi:ketosteroid isomerase-like protein
MRDYVACRAPRDAVPAVGRPAAPDDVSRVESMSEDEGRFASLEAEILDCLVASDMGRLRELLDDEFVITTAGWMERPSSRDEWIEGLAAQHGPLESYQVHSVDVRMLSDVAVVLVLSTQRAVWKGEPFEGQFRYTDVFRRTPDGRWRLHTRHANLRPQD